VQAACSSLSKEGKLTSMAAAIGTYVAAKLFRRASSGVDAGPDDTSTRSSKAQSTSGSLASVTLSNGIKLSKGDRVRCPKGDGVVGRILSNQLWKEPYICIALDSQRPSSPKRNRRYLQETQDALQEASDRLALPAASVYVCSLAEAVKVRALPCVLPYQARADGRDSIKYLCAVCDAVTPAKSTVNCDDSAQQQGGHTVCLKHIEPTAGDGAVGLTDRLRHKGVPFPALWAAAALERRPSSYEAAEHWVVSTHLASCSVLMASLAAISSQSFDCNSHCVKYSISAAALHHTAASSQYM
jgi:hypothetical protein